MNRGPSTHHTFCIDLAIEYGMEEAILIHHFQYWIDINQTKGTNFHEGKTWMYQTRKEISAHFPYWSPDKIRRLTDKLVEKKVLVKGNFNKKEFDKTIWYAFSNEGIFTNGYRRNSKFVEENKESFTTGKSASSTGKSASSIGKSAKPIPNTKTHIYINRSIDSFEKEDISKPPPNIEMHECLRNLDIPEKEKIELTRKYPDRLRMENAVAFATQHGFEPNNLVAVIIRNYQLNRKPSVAMKDMTVKNKEFAKAITPILQKAIGNPNQSHFETLTKYLEFIPGGVAPSTCWLWEKLDFMAKVRKHFTEKGLWSRELEGIYMKLHKA